MKTHLLALLLALPFACASLEARNLEGKTGLGISMVDFDASPAISLRTHASSHSSLTVLAGFDSLSTVNRLIIGAKLYQNAHLEEYMNFFVGIGGFLVSHRDTTDSNIYSGVEIDGLMGGEFFFTEIPNLGFLFETGIAMRALKEVEFKTVGSGFLGLAIHYYF